MVLRALLDNRWPNTNQFACIGKEIWVFKVLHLQLNTKLLKFDAYNSPIRKNCSLPSN